MNYSEIVKHLEAVHGDYGKELYRLTEIFKGKGKGLTEKEIEFYFNLTEKQFAVRTMNAAPKLQPALAVLLGLRLVLKKNKDIRYEPGMVSFRCLVDDGNGHQIVPITKNAHLTWHNLLTPTDIKANRVRIPIGFRDFFWISPLMGDSEIGELIDTIPVEINGEVQEVHITGNWVAIGMRYFNKPLAALDRNYSYNLHWSFSDDRKALKIRIGERAGTTIACKCQHDNASTFVRPQLAHPYDEQIQATA